MKQKPLVSFICVSMNHEQYVVQGVGSYVAQTYSNIEFLFLDNNSTDQSFEISDKLFRESGRSYKGYKRTTNHNLPQNFNYLVEQAKGEYLCFISCDDWVKPEYVATMLEAYQQQQHVGLLYSNGWYYYEDTKQQKLALEKSFPSGKIFDHIFLDGVPFPPGIMVKRSTFDKIGLFNEAIPIEDYEFWLRVALQMEIGSSREPMVYYRKHSASMTSTATGYRYFGYYQQIADQYKSHRLYKKVSRNFRKWNIYHNFLKKENKKALQLIMKDFRFERFYFAMLYRMAIGKRKIERRT